VKRLKEKVERYDDIDTVMKKMESKVAELKHQGRVFEKTFKHFYLM
jgi:hypothetical protein